MTDLPPGKKVIKNRWVFVTKSDGRKKARLVAKGFSQVEGIDFDEIFSPVVRYETVRLMFATAALENWCFLALDVVSAFLYGKLDEEIYMQLPEGFMQKGQERKVLRLKRSLYGLKQAALSWWKELEASMKTMGFKCLFADARIFIHRNEKTGLIVIAIIYVDDGIFMGPDRAYAQKKKAEFMVKWECRDLGDAKEFLSMRICKIGHKILLDQVPYLTKVLERFGMTNAKVAYTPLPTGWQPTKNTAPNNSQI
ncbi:putative mitochondrial protein [Lyophyllum shimeji]|uniref:Mitochondrial protein n=1 Tax=Lyophyllum shimeji TaxID=47721 RepID=A0A9P3UT85_LYOSH|nr:putative mitochondrial protein [Lyophyllum shimeji]